MSDRGWRKREDEPGEESAAVFAVVVLKNAVHTLDTDLVGLGEDVEPGCKRSGSEEGRKDRRKTERRTDDSPESVLLANVVRTGTERLLTADGETASVHEVTEELPSCVLLKRKLRCEKEKTKKTYQWGPRSTRSPSPWRHGRWRWK